MTVILAANHATSKPFYTTISHFLHSCYSAITIDSARLSVPDQSANLLLGSFDSFTHISCPQIIALFSAGTCMDLELDFPLEGGIAIVDSSDETALISAGNSKLPAVTCGLSPRDTITLSSIGVDDAVVNLQRSIQCFDGTIAEPQEFPIRLTGPIDSFALMALVAILLLNGDEQSLKELSL